LFCRSDELGRFGLKIEFLFIHIFIESMLASAANILPSYTSSQIADLVYTWETMYGDAAGTVWEEGVTGAFPFSWLIATSLDTISKDLNMNFTRSEFNNLTTAWGQLTPWEGTQEALEILAKGNLDLGVLSNGDWRTLHSDVSIFTSPVSFKYVFPSDFPVGAFKPQSAMYHQTLALGYDISEILHVAGGSGDASGARDAGLFSVYLAKTYLKSGDHLFDDSADEKSTPPCFTINDISELPAILGL
jgi:FMN phosphatase YigB (HAD superfamily)